MVEHVITIPATDDGQRAFEPRRDNGDKVERNCETRRVHHDSLRWHVGADALAFELAAAGF